MTTALHLLVCVFAVFLFAGSLSEASETREPHEPVEPPETPRPASAPAGPTWRDANTPTRIVLAGDSTVTDRVGWGLGFTKCYAEPGKTEVINLARGGRSSKSFRDEGRWQMVLDLKPTHILIQFGHNDQPGKGPERETDPNTTFRENLSRFIDETRAVGAQPVLLTSLERRRWGDAGRLKPTLAAYAEAARAVAAEKDVPLIDLHARSIETYESLGPAGCEQISPLEPDGRIDITHLNEAGGRMFGEIVADEVRRAVPDLADNYHAFREEEQPAETP